MSSVRLLNLCPCESGLNFQLVLKKYLASKEKKSRRRHIINKQQITN